MLAKETAPQTPSAKQANRRHYFWIAILPVLALPALWWIYPYATSSFIDTADTEGYIGFVHRTAYRIIIAIIADLFYQNGISPNIMALVFNTFAIAYLFYLLRISPFGHLFQNRWKTLAILCCSPLLVLVKNKVATDFYAGLCAFHLMIIFERLRARIDAGETIPLKAYLAPAFFVFFAMNLKETVIVPLFLYTATVFSYHPRRYWKPILIASLMPTLYWPLSRAVFWFYFNNAFYDYDTFFRISKGGNGVAEIGGSTASIPVPLFLYHIFSHLKLIGRYGVAAFVTLLGLFAVRRQFYGRLYIVSVIFFTLIAFRGYLTLERYWQVLLPVQLVLFAFLLEKIRTMRYGAIAAPLVIAAGLTISFANYFLRYFPPYS